MTLFQNVRHRTVEEHRRQKAAARDVPDPEDCRKGKVACKRDVPDEEEGRKGKVAAHAEADLPGGIVVRELVARQKETTSESAKARTSVTSASTTAKITAKATTSVSKTTSVSSTSAKSTSNSSTSSTSASSTSATSISSTSSSSITSSSTTSSIINTSSSAIDRAFSSITSPSLSASAPDSSSSLGASIGDNAPSAPASGLQTGSIIGIIAGSIAALMLIGAVISFFLRRLRTQRRGDEVFNPSQFRRSAVLLEEKQPDVRPRPPTMIERRNVQGTPSVVSNSLPPPSMAYPYSDRSVPPSPSVPPSMHGGTGSDHGHHQQQYAQFGATGAHFGNLTSPAPSPSAGGMYNGVPAPGAYGAHYEQAGYGAPPVPGTYAPGAYASYGQDLRYQQMQFQQQSQQRQQPQGYPNFAPYQQQQPHPGHYGHGSQPYPAGYGAGHTGPQSFAPAPVAQSASSVSSAPSAAKQTLHLASAPDDILEGGSGSGLRRQPTQSSGAPPAYVDEVGESNKYRDVKMKPVVMTAPMESSAGSSKPIASAATSAPASAAAPQTSTAQKRTSTRSAYSLYDQDDIYGGI